MEFFFEDTGGHYSENRCVCMCICGVQREAVEEHIMQLHRQVGDLETRLQVETSGKRLLLQQVEQLKAQLKEYQETNDVDDDPDDAR